MAKMLNCKACSKEIAKGVNKCIHCGKDQRNFFMKHKVLTVILALVILGGINSAMGGAKGSASTTTPATSTTAKSTPVEKKVAVLKVSAVVLAKAYEENEVKADKDYKGKTIETTGEIDDIGVMLGETFIILSAGKDFAITNVQCFFDEKTEIDKIASLKKGDTVTIQGVVDGKSINVGVKKSTLK